MAHSALGQIALSHANFAAARLHYEASLAGARAIEAVKYIVLALDRLAYLAKESGDYQRARTLLEEASTVSRGIGNRHGIAEGLSIARDGGDLSSAAGALNRLGELARIRGLDAEAAAHYRESLALWRELGQPQEAALVLHNLGHVGLRTGDINAARDAFGESIATWRRLSNPLGIALCLFGYAGLAIAAGAAACAARWIGAASVVLEQLGVVADKADRSAHERLIAAARSQLDAPAYRAACEAGRALRVEDAAAEALAFGAAVDADAAQPLPQAYPHGLTEREVEVLRLLAAGLTNAGIAERLVISPRTVNTHLTAIYSKLDVSSRSAATRLAIEHDLV
jgi:DNA-binding CsgD family transcriptional regulator